MVGAENKLISYRHCEQSELFETVTFFERAWGGFGSGVRVGPVRMKLCQILIFWSFCIKTKGQGKDIGFQ